MRRVEPRSVRTNGFWFGLGRAETGMTPDASNPRWFDATGEGIIHRDMRPAGVAIVVAIAIGASGCSSAGKPETTAAPGTTVPGYLACGAPAASLGRLSLPGDRVQLTITSVSRTKSSLTVGYEISSPVRGVGIGYPFVPVPPTLLLIHDGAVKGVEPTVSVPLPPGVVSAQDPVLRALPYRGTLTLARLCPGLSWPRVWRDRGDYTAAVVVTRLTEHVTSTAYHLLSEAVTAAV